MTMPVDRARQVLLEVIELRKRFGIQVSSRDFSHDDLLDALIVLNEHNEETVHAELVKLKRQLGAAKSREVKAKNRTDRMQETIDMLEKQHAEDARTIRGLSHDLAEAQSTVKALQETQ